jgi:hypothetical protein
VLTRKIVELVQAGGRFYVEKDEIDYEKKNRNLAKTELFIPLAGSGV